MQSIEAQFAERFTMVEGHLSADVLQLADDLVEDHLPQVA
jgi:hypothetical protein